MNIKCRMYIFRWISFLISRYFIPSKKILFRIININVINIPYKSCIANKHLYQIGNQIEDAKSIKTFFASFHNSQICISPIRRQIYYHFYFIVILLKMCFALAACKCIFTAVACMWHIKTNDLKQLKAHETNYVLIGGHFSSIALICNQNILC